MHACAPLGVSSALMNHCCIWCRLVSLHSAWSPSSLGASPSPPSVRAALAPSRPPVPVCVPSDRVCPACRQNVTHALKSMGNLLSRDTEDPANGAGLNLKLLKEMWLPPPAPSQRNSECDAALRQLTSFRRLHSALVTLTEYSIQSTQAHCTALVQHCNSQQPLQPPPLRTEPECAVCHKLLPPRQ